MLTEGHLAAPEGALEEARNVLRRLGRSKLISRLEAQYKEYSIDKCCWFEGRRTAGEFGNASVGNHQQERQLVVFDSVTTALAPKRTELT